jgi:hypothetical protein
LTSELGTAIARRGDLVAVSEEIDQVLGHLVFYSLPEGYLDHEGLSAAWVGQQLPAELLPREPSFEGVFQRACRSVETRRAAHRVEVKVSEVARSEEEIVFQVNFLVRLPGRRIVEHPKALRLTLKRKTRIIAAVGLGDDAPLLDSDGSEVALPDSGEIVRRVRAHYRDHQGQIHTDTLRRMVREALRKAHAQPVRESGGVWFVPRRHRSVVTGIGEVFSQVAGKGAEWHRIPLANDVAQRAMVRRHLVSNCEKVVARQIALARQALSSREGMEETRLAQIMAEQRRVRQIASEYRALLEDELLEVDAQMEILSAQVERLVFGAVEVTAAAG